MKIDLKTPLKLYKTGDIVGKGDIYMICKIKRDGRQKFFFLNLYTSESLGQEFDSVSELLSHYYVDDTWQHHNGDEITIKNY